MSWTLLLGVVLVLGLALFAAISRRAELARMKKTVRAREHAVRQGSAEAQLQQPIVDLSRCLGCGTCVAVCPEDGVLDLVHGQAMVVNGARCMGISACERECPVGAITVTIANLEKREDIPAVNEQLEAIGSPGLFLAGEVTAHALIKTAIEHGAAVGAEVARQIREQGPGPEGVLDLCIVGAGPAGLACALEARRLGLDFVVLEQESGPGGTVAKYPRRKLVMAQSVDMPLYGRLKARTYTKEQLIDLWRHIAAEHELPIENGAVFSGLDHDDDGNYLVNTQDTSWAARFVCLAIGRRGIPRKLGVPGEELPKVAYSLLDANSYQGRRILVVGGGDSAVEAAMGLAEQPGNQVVLSYRKEGFFRIRSKNEQRLRECVQRKTMRVVLRSRLTAIHPDSVSLEVDEGHRVLRRKIPNDDVFIMAGGVAPFQLLERSGVSFDPKLREKVDPITEQGSGLVRALIVGFLLALCTLGWALWHYDYYSLPSAARPAHPKHVLLRPELGIGLGLGVAAVLLIVLNLLYLLRRSPRFALSVGSLKLWMTSHVATGILALLCAMLHSAMSPRDSAGGIAFWALAALLVTGAIGRYFYAYVPRATNGRELELAAVKARLGRMSEEWDQGQIEFRERVRNQVHDLIEKKQWNSSFVGRLFALLGVRRGLNRVLDHLAAEGREQGIAEDQIDETLRLARRAHGAALMVAHYEDLRALLGTWRYLHRWVAALLVLLIVVHVVDALVYGAFFFDGGAG